MNFFQVKYYTKEEALEAVKKNGGAIERVSAQLKDDYDLVRTAIINGGMLSSASHRLQNDVSLITLSARIQISKYFDPLCCDFPEIIFAAKNNKELLEIYKNAFSDWEEFNLEMKLFYGDAYDSPIKAYNELTLEELREELILCRKQLILDCLEVYKKTRKGAYSEESIKRNKKLSHSIRYRTLRWGITSWEKVEKPATYIIDMLETENDRIRSWISESAQKTGGSYPERFMDAVLKSINIDFCREQVFPWAENKRYDFYLPDSNTIIEIHGAQHYEGGFEKLGGKDLVHEQLNDKLKELMAKNNGISNYIVVNAMSSSFEYIRNSICNNSAFCKLFDVAEIDWVSVASIIEAMQKPKQLPLYQEKIQYNSMLIELFRAAIELKPKMFSVTSITDSMQFFNKFPSSQGGLQSQELLLLSRVSSYQVGEIPEYIFTKWKNHFQVDMYVQIKHMIETGYLCVGDISKKLDMVNVSILKKILHEKGLDISGKKQEIVNRLREHVSVHELNQLIPTKFYELTEKGKNELIEYLYTFTGTTLKSKLVLETVRECVDYKMLFEDIYNYPRRYIQHIHGESIEFWT